MDFRRVFLENWGIKLVSLLMALMLWFYVTSKGKTEMTLSVPLELRNIPQGQVLVGDVAGKVEVRMQGKERILRDAVSGNKVYGVIDLARAVSGENFIRISPDDIRRPAGVAVTRISPYDVKLTLEPLLKKTYKLKVRLWGSPASGFATSAVTVKPVRITAEGPQSIIQSLEILQTVPIDISGSRESLLLEPKIDYEGKPIKILEKDIMVKVSIVRKAISR